MHLVGDHMQRLTLAVAFKEDESLENQGSDQAWKPTIKEYELEEYNWVKSEILEFDTE